MRRLPRLVSALALVIAGGLYPATAAHAATGANSEEWWFKDWDVQGKVWPITKGQGVTVAVLDTGVNAKLPDLAGATVPGTDFKGGDGLKDTDDETDSHGHGTSMAITIAGQGDRYGWRGIAPDVKILPIDGQMTDLAKAIPYAVSKGAKVLNVSQGIPSQGVINGCDDATIQALRYAQTHDLVVVVAAGNFGATTNVAMFPATCPGVVAVGAVGPGLKPWSGTERQSYVTVSGPGEEAGLIGRDGILYHNSWGTSIATALTSAEAALIFAKYPNMSAREVVERIIATAYQPGGGGHNNSTGYGIIRPHLALVTTPPANTPDPVYGGLSAWLSTHPPASMAPTAPLASGDSGSDDVLMARLIAGFGVLVVVVVIGTAVWLVVRARKRRLGPPLPPPTDPARQGPPTGFGGGGRPGEQGNRGADPWS